MGAKRSTWPIWVVAATLSAGAASATDLTSGSFRLRGLHPESLGPARLVSPSGGTPVSASGVSLGQGEALGPSGSATDLTSSFPGFWALAAGSIPSLDTDGDLRPTFLDPDDDGDGLDDLTEIGTTGTDPLDPDSDGDGFGDGIEDAAGTDPLDPASHPIAAAVPALSGGAYALLAALLLGLALPLLHGRKSHGPDSKR